jgi:hypothetical protein
MIKLKIINKKTKKKSRAQAWVTQCMALPTETTLFFFNFSSLVDSSTPIFLERVINLFSSD